MNKKTFYIREVAKITGRCPHTIRNYIRRGLISETDREWNGFRVFTDEHIRQINVLKKTDIQKRKGQCDAKTN